MDDMPACFTFSLLAYPPLSIEQFVQLAAGDDRERALREQNAKLRDTIAAMREEGATMSVRAQQLEEQVEVWTACVTCTFAELSASGSEKSSQGYMHVLGFCSTMDTTIVMSSVSSHNHPYMLSRPRIRTRTRTRIQGMIDAGRRSADELRRARAQSAACASDAEALRAQLRDARAGKNLGLGGAGMWRSHQREGWVFSLAGWVCGALVVGVVLFDSKNGL
jgi:hypothetical protein